MVNFYKTNGKKLQYEVLNEKLISKIEDYENNYLNIIIWYLFNFKFLPNLFL